MQYRSVSDLNLNIAQNLHRIPRDVQLVVGIPRSGMLAANLIALQLNVPMTDVDGFLAGRTIGGGTRLRLAREHREARTAPGTILLVDDCVGGGTQMARVRDALDRAGVDQSNVCFLAPYVTPSARSKVDVFFDVVEMPRVFEWNVMHHGAMPTWCVDIDGVLCRDPSVNENDDGPLYEQFLTNVEPLLRPSTPIGWLVTCRLEKYRGLTEQWLARHGIEYGELIMLNVPTKAERQRLGNHGSFKGRIYRRLDAELFIESSARQSPEIARAAGKSVWCVETRAMIQPSTAAILKHDVAQRPLSIPRRLVRAMRRRLAA